MTISVTPRRSNKNSDVGPVWAGREGSGGADSTQSQRFARMTIVRTFHQFASSTTFGVLEVSSSPRPAIAPKEISDPVLEAEREMAAGAGIMLIAQRVIPPDGT